MSAADHWARVVRHAPLALLIDLDGTLVPFAPRPDLAHPEPALVEFLDALAALPGLVAAVVSGRSRPEIERFFASTRALWLVAEHGAFLRGDGIWHSSLAGSSGEIDDLQATLEEVAHRTSGAAVERKSWTVAFHYRAVVRSSKAPARIEAEASIRAWLRLHPGYDCIAGSEVLEIRPTAARKSTAVHWVRERCGADTRIIALGDDVTDEDMFRALGASDEGILVAAAHERPTAARWSLRAPDDVLRFLRWIRDARAEASTSVPLVLPVPVPLLHPPVEARSNHALLAISNRLPDFRAPVSPDEERRRPVGGLVAALEPVLASRGGLWLGWSGRTCPDDSFGAATLDAGNRPALAWIDLPATAYERYYNGLCNRSLWPLFHSLPERVHFADTDWEAYVAVNDRLAEVASELVPPDCPVWAHDFHLLLVASGLRRRGHGGPLGLFLHVPFPGVDLFRILPWGDALLEGMLAFDLLGFQTAYDVRNFLQVVGALSAALTSDDAVQHRGRRVRVHAFPIGIIPESFEPPSEPEDGDEAAALLASLEGRRLAIGVDRLDYTKGIPERLEAFARLLALYPEWRGKVSMVQISVPSRADVLEYQEQRHRIEAVVGRVNGEFGEAHWTPVRYLYRSYRRSQLSQLYRAADVCLVTPLRDGMNLVAKEFVAAQEPDRPGVLVLSRFAGAAFELTDAVLTNPFHTDGMARDVDRALRMPPEERRERHARLLAAVHRTSATSWAESFVAALEVCRAGPDAGR